MARQIGSRVKIVSGGMREFHGSTGTVVDIERHRGEPVMYRVYLDVPVRVQGFGAVMDDLWCGECLQTLRGER
jgi:hypothetical protein